MIVIGGWSNGEYSSLHSWVRSESNKARRKCWYFAPIALPHKKGRDGKNRGGKNSVKRQHQDKGHERVGENQETARAARDMPRFD